MRRLMLSFVAGLIFCPNHGSLADDSLKLNIQRLPEEVKAALNNEIRTCKNRPKLERGLVEQRDVNADGITDFILHFEKLECDDEKHFYCGSGGCLIKVFASLPGGRYANVFDFTVREVHFKVREKTPIMITDVHGSFCGRIGAAPCEKYFYWDGTTFVLKKH